MASDAKLVLAARAGDPASLGVLLERHRAPLYGMALRLLGHCQQAEDAVHDTFLVALCKLDQVREPAAVGGWMQVAFHHYGKIDRMRWHLATRPRTEGSWEEEILNPHQSNVQPHAISNDL